MFLSNNLHVRLATAGEYAGFRIRADDHGLWHGGIWCNTVIFHSLIQQFWATSIEDLFEVEKKSSSE